ncbi:MAG: Gfo/Idh/MocA family oxidoreductase [Helicobacter sp.]|nr:Gfo/Idh/MocA family oxidoreductase [Helicobacter sp.]
MRRKTFGIIGVGGFVAPRHLGAIKSVGGDLLCALDKFDSVGILDSFFPEAHFFTEFERFDRHISKLKRANLGLDFISICSPNYLHDSHIRFALKNGANAICEKPLVLNPWNLPPLIELEAESKNNVFCVLQLRLHEQIIKLKNYIANELKNNPNKIFDVDLTYITPRGRWYFQSWKGNEARSGGLCSNIGVHFFDMLCFIFGECLEIELHYKSDRSVCGILHLKNARVRWFLSIDIKFSKEPSRFLIVEGQKISFDSGFADLHNKTYEHILKDGGFGINDAKESIKIIHQIRNLEAIAPKDLHHEMLENL